MKIVAIIIAALLLIILISLTVLMFKFVIKIDDENKKENEKWK